MALKSKIEYKRADRLENILYRDSYASGDECGFDGDDCYDDDHCYDEDDEDAADERRDGRRREIIDDANDMAAMLVELIQARHDEQRLVIGESCDADDDLLNRAIRLAQRVACNSFYISDLMV